MHPYIVTKLGEKQEYVNTLPTPDSRLDRELTQPNDVPRTNGSKSVIQGVVYFTTVKKVLESNPVPTKTLSLEEVGRYLDTIGFAIKDFLEKMSVLVSFFTREECPPALHRMIDIVAEDYFAIFNSIRADV